MIGSILTAALAIAPVDGFLERNATRPGVQQLPGGIQYRVLEAGPASGARPRLGDEVKVHYEGRLLTGRIFDSSFARDRPAILSLKRLIPCWTDVLPRMRAGDDWIIFCPSDKGYGAAGAGTVIPPNSTLAFRIRLLDVLPAKPSP